MTAAGQGTCLRANAIAERWIASARREGPDRMLVTGERHLRLVLDEVICRYRAGAYAEGAREEAQPHRALTETLIDFLHVSPVASLH